MNKLFIKEYFISQEEQDYEEEFKLMDLDCANCAAKMEDAIKKLIDVNDANSQLYDAETDFGYR